MRRRLSKVLRSWEVWPASNLWIDGEGIGPNYEFADAKAIEITGLIEADIGESTALVSSPAI